ncbi:calmodulin-dependent protein kinase [Gigaspora margarita]|uniref:Calmodulin-dependent protein kinase n=1 Tax=Gigaspora margarita TaxID=4874 RepID=A0A8H4AZA2_GIGMA|nr:calmodulin-dependent protein kinase [Gigaspora margarita]
MKFDLDSNPIEDEGSKMKNLEDLKDNQQENYGLKSAKEIPSNEGRLVHKNKAFDYHQKATDMGNINRVGYCYQDGFGIEEDEHKAFEYYKKSTDAGSANRIGMCKQERDNAI